MSQNAFLLTVGFIVHNGRKLVRLQDGFWLVDKNGRVRANRPLTRKIVDALLELMEPDSIQNGSMTYRFRKGVPLPAGVIVPKSQD